MLPFMSDKCKPVERLQIYTAQQTAKQGWALHHAAPEAKHSSEQPGIWAAFEWLQQEGY